MAIKKFSENLFNHNDSEGKQVVSDWLSKNYGLSVTSPEKYGIDLHIFKKSSLVAFGEVERRSWKANEDGSPPYSSFHVPFRKKKFFEKESSVEIILFVIPACKKWLYWTRAYNIISSRIISVSNIYVQRNEKFYDVASKYFKKECLF